jgi:hypothetical protein
MFRRSARQVGRGSLVSKLQELDIVLPEKPHSVGKAVSCIVVGQILHVPLALGGVDNLAISHSSTSTGSENPPVCEAILQAVCMARDTLVDLNRIHRAVRMNVYSSISHGIELEQIADTASDFLVLIFGSERGKHARSVIGACALPQNATVAVDVLFEVEPSASHSLMPMFP